MTENKNVTYDPGSYIHGVNMIYNARSIAKYSPVGNYSLYVQVLNYDWEEYQERLNGTAVTDLQRALMDSDKLAPLTEDFYCLFQVKSYQNLYDKITAGEVSPGLEKILNRQPWYNSEVFHAILNRGGFKEIVLNAVNDGKIDFTPFNNTDDKTPDWFLKYRLSPVPVPGYFGRASDLGKGVGGKTTLQNSKDRIKAEIKEHTINALQNGVTKEILLSMTAEVKARYQALKKSGEKNYYNSVFPYTTKHMAGFVVDVSAEEIFDLRPYVDELREILAPGVEPLKEFYLLVERYLRNYEKQQKEKTGLFKDEPFIPLRNTPESNAVSSLTGGITAMAIQDELFDTDENGNPLYNYQTTIPIKSGDVIVKVSGTPKGRALRPSTQKLKILCDALFTRRSNRTLVFNKNEYMELCEIPDTKEARKEFSKNLRQNLRTLNKTSFNLKSTGITAGEVSIISSWTEFKDGTIQISLTPEYCALLQGKRSGIFSITEYVYRSDERNIHIIPFLIKLHWNRQMYKNVNKGNNRANTISMKSLIESDPDFLAKCKKNINRESRRYIIEPTIKVISILNKEKVITSRFIDKDGIEHTKDELSTVTLGDFMNPEKWLLLYDIVGYQDDPKQIQEAKDRAENREETKMQKAYKKGYRAGKQKAEKQ